MTDVARRGVVHPPLDNAVIYPVEAALECAISRQVRQLVGDSTAGAGDMLHTADVPSAVLVELAVQHAIFPPAVG